MWPSVLLAFPKGLLWNLDWAPWCSRLDVHGAAAILVVYIQPSALGWVLRDLRQSLSLSLISTKVYKEPGSIPVCLICCTAEYITKLVSPGRYQLKSSGDEAQAIFMAGDVEA